MIYVIADDLTGANDTGVQFAKHGLKTKVIIPDKDNQEIKVGKADVLVIDTETRNLDGKNARNKLINILNQIEFNEQDIIYKKVDSTMRGNIGIELEETMKKLKKDICIFTPSFPANNRITVDGYLIICKQIMQDKNDYSGLKDEDSYIPSIIKKQTDLKIGQIKSDEINNEKINILDRIIDLNHRGNKIIVVDAIKERDLKKVITGANKYTGSILYSGSAGMANSLAASVKNGINKTKTKSKYESEYLDSKSPILIVGGTRNSSLNSQISYLDKNMELNIINIDVSKIMKNKMARKNYFNSIINDINAKQHIVIRIAPHFNKNKIIEQIKVNQNLKFRELELLIRDSLSELAKIISYELDINNFITTGGDTSLGVCKTLGIQYLNVFDELLSGIPLLTAKDLDDKKINFVTKAGDFGDEDTLYRLVNKLTI